MAWRACPDGFIPDPCDTNATRGIKGAALRAGWRILDEWGGRCTFISGPTTLTMRFVPPAPAGQPARPVADYVHLWRNGEAMDVPPCLRSGFVDTDLTACIALLGVFRRHAAGAAEPWHAA